MWREQGKALGAAGGDGATINVNAKMSQRGENGSFSPD